MSAYGPALPFLWLAVDDPPRRESHRGIIERGAIGLLSRRVKPLADAPSADWLGLHAVAPEIRTSGVWKVNHVDQRYWVARTLDNVDYRAQRSRQRRPPNPLAGFGPCGTIAYGEPTPARYRRRGPG